MRYAPVMHAVAFPSFAGALRPSLVAAGWTYDAVLIVLGSAVLALSARVVIVLPPVISPVPVTGQTFAVLLIGALYGSRRGTATIVVYLAEGLAGLPVFAAGGAGLPQLLGPTGGYLVGFVAAAFVVGGLAERGWDRRWTTTALAMGLGTIVLFVPGLIWLSFMVGPSHVLAVGLLPFLPGAVLKIALAALLLPMGWRGLAWLRGRSLS